MKISGSSISILAAFALLIGSLFVLGNLIQPLYAQINDVRLDKANKDAQYEKNKEINAQINNIISSYQNYTDLRNTLEQVFPINSDMPQEIYQINGLANMTGLTINSANISPLPVKPSRYVSIKGRAANRLNVNLSGNYESFKSFLGKLESNVRLFAINSIVIEPSHQRLNEFDFRMEINAYYQAP